MRVPKSVVKERMQKFLDACRQRNIKVTHQRIEIFRQLASTKEHPDVHMIHRRILKRMPTVAVDTVYRNLRLLERQGLISIVGKSHERLRFDANMEPHHHFSCVECDRIVDIEFDHAPRLTWPAEAAAVGKPLSFRLEIRGICKNCRKD